MDVENVLNQLHALVTTSPQEPVNRRKILQSHLLSLAFKQVLRKDAESIYVSEIRNVCGSEKNTEEKLCEMPYLSANFQETLRRDSPVAIIPLRYVHGDTELGGYHIPAETEEIWENPEEWNSERFLNEKGPIDLQRTMAFGVRVET